ncbi:SDR family oxidoreductase [Aggregicoccus sp. 17bor-14]|uniref:SDR family oxidoreductase n=1 Tax=Myxococcaceae TaxID=31 RepID=UPI0012F31AB9|nr:SDR family oxidoreductase [Simulacricoccus sp. 17bor-14]MRI88675.1 SDR family oxidoreductase [Aggregicoccus sp. 17bor-14]
MKPGRLFVTGGASGLGRAIALRFARAGFKVCIGDLHEQRGAQVERELGADGLFLRCDVRKEEDLRRVAQTLEQRWGGVDVVVNNAGVAGAGAIEDLPLEDWQWIIDINLLGVVRGCRVFTPLLKRQGAGHIVNVASMAGLMDVPLMSSYNATKAAVVSLSETLDNELADAGIGVSVVCPSFFRTNLHESMRTKDPGLAAAMNKLLDRSPITAEDIAERIFRAVERKEFYVLPHADGRAAWRLKRLLPRGAYTAIIRKQLRKLQAAAMGSPAPKENA